MLLKLSAFLPCPPLPYLRPTRRLRTTAQINGPDGLPNARDLATASPRLRPGRLFRGATPAALKENPHPDAVNFLRSTSLLLDLRSKDERRTDNREEMATNCGPDFNRRERHISLLNKRRIVWGLTRVLPHDQTRDLALRMARNPFSARQGVVSRMDQGGLILLNRILVQAGAGSIGRAMISLTDGVQRGPVYFYCSAGKDRTGLLAALVLKVLGVDDYDIITDYARSSECWENGPYQLRADYCGRLEHAGLTPRNWLGAPPKVMWETLDYIERRYGSVEEYLTYCGYGEARMMQLRQSLLIPDSSHTTPVSPVR